MSMIPRRLFQRLARPTPTLSPFTNTFTPKLASLAALSIRDVRVAAHHIQLRDNADTPEWVTNIEHWTTALPNFGKEHSETKVKVFQSGIVHLRAKVLAAQGNAQKLQEVRDCLEIMEKVPGVFYLKCLYWTSVVDTSCEKTIHASSHDEYNKEMYDFFHEAHTDMCVHLAEALTFYINDVRHPEIMAIKALMCWSSFWMSWFRGTTELPHTPTQRELFMDVADNWVQLLNSVRRSTSIEDRDFFKLCQCEVAAFTVDLLTRVHAVEGVFHEILVTHKHRVNFSMLFPVVVHTPDYAFESVTHNPRQRDLYMATDLLINALFEANKAVGTPMDMLSVHKAGVRHFEFMEQPRKLDRWMGKYREIDIYLRRHNRHFKDNFELTEDGKIISPEDEHVAATVEGKETKKEGKKDGGNGDQAKQSKDSVKKEPPKLARPETKKEEKKEFGKPIIFATAMSPNSDYRK